MEKPAAPLYMTKKPGADASAVRRARGQAGNIGHDELAAPVGHDAQLRVERGEGIGADLRLRVGDGVAEGRLAVVGEADEPGVGEQPQAMPTPPLPPRPAGALLALSKSVGKGERWSVGEDLGARRMLKEKDTQTATRR